MVPIVLAVRSVESEASDEYPPVESVAKTTAMETVETVSSDRSAGETTVADRRRASEAASGKAPACHRSGGEATSADRRRASEAAAKAATTKSAASKASAVEAAATKATAAVAATAKATSASVA